MIFDIGVFFDGAGTVCVCYDDQYAIGLSNHDVCTRQPVGNQQPMPLFTIPYVYTCIWEIILMCLGFEHLRVFGQIV